MGHLQVSRLIPASPQEVFERITDLRELPQWLEGDLQVHFPTVEPKLEEMGEFEVEMSRWGFTVQVIARVEELVPMEKFSYRQVSGFFAAWTHAQVLKAHGPGMTLLTDLVEFRLPGGLIGAVLDDLIVRRDLESILMRRLERLEEQFSSRPAGGEK